MAKLRAIPKPVEIKWSSEISGEHRLVFMWDESVDEIVVNVVTGGGMTGFTLSHSQAKRIKRLIEWHKETQEEA